MRRLIVEGLESFALPKTARPHPPRMTGGGAESPPIGRLSYLPYEIPNGRPTNAECPARRS